MKKTLLLLTMLSASSTFAGQTLTSVEKEVQETIKEIPAVYDMENTGSMKSERFGFEEKKSVPYKRQDLILEYKPKKETFEKVGMYYTLEAEELKYFCKDMSKEVNLTDENEKVLNAVCLSNILLENKFKKTKGNKVENIVGIQSYRVREICQEILTNTIRSQVFLLKEDRAESNVYANIFSSCVESITELDTFFK
jgi:methionine-rich copper-binding protein CopC